jgi:hypothetical protein
MDQRVEQILLTIAQQYAQPLLQTWERRGDYNQRLPRLARGLANYGILVIMGDQPYSLRGLSDDVRVQIQDWVNSYAQFYYVLTQTLFPSYMQMSAHYTDDKWPLVIFMRGSAAAVIQRMAGYIAPFVFYRQMDAKVSEIELAGVMDLILEELEASSLPIEVYRKLRADGVNILKHLLEVQIRQLLLTDFDQPIFTDSRRFAVPPTLPGLPLDDSQVTRPDRQPPSAREDTARLTQTQSVFQVTPPTWQNPPQPTPAKPATAPLPPVEPPETKAEPPPAAPPKPQPEENQFGSSIPIFFKRKDASKKIRPPLPPLPGDKES